MISIISTIGYAVLVVLMFSLAIFIHEFGHFIAAIKLGFQVDAFSIGFGPAIWKKKIKGVEYRISWIPFGGYVALPQLDPAGMEKVQGSHGDSKAELPDVSPWKRIIVAVAGPLGNVVLAVVIAFSLAAIPSARFGELDTTVGGVFEEGPAANADIKAGDRIDYVNDRRVRTWHELQTEVIISGEDKALSLSINRDGVLHTESIIPKKDEVTGAVYIGIFSTTNNAKASVWMPSRNPFKQLAFDASGIVRVLQALVTPSSSKAVAKQLGGPISIAGGLYLQAKNNGILDAFGFLRFLCINLMIMNLLPLPVLDGGHCMFALWEIVTRRRPSRRFVDIISSVFGYALIGLMLLLVFSDCSRFWRMRQVLFGVKEPAAAVEETDLDK